MGREELTIEIVMEYRNKLEELKKTKLTVLDFKRLGQDLRDRFGLTDFAAIVILRGDPGWEEQVIKYNREVAHADSNS